MTFLTTISSVACLGLAAASLTAAPQGLGKGEGIEKPEVHKGSLLITAAKIYVAKDRVLENDAILVRNGKVLYVGAEIPVAARNSATKLAFPGMTIVPGFVNPHSSLGQSQHLSERIDTFTPELEAGDAFDPFAPAVQQSARAGITAAGLAPSSFNAFAGQAAAIRTGRIGSVIDGSTYLKMSMIDAAFDQQRYPTSRMGAAELIRDSFRAAKSPLGATDARLKVLADVIAGGRQLMLHVQTQAEIDNVLDICKEIGVKPVLLGCDEGHKCLDRIATEAAGVVLSPISFGSAKHRLQFAGKLEKRGLPFSFMAERPESLRISGALAVRYGATSKGVLSALTQTAAKHIGAADHVGTLFEGKSADFCVYTGHPLDLTSSLVHTYIAGVQHRAKEKK